MTTEATPKPNWVVNVYMLSEFYSSFTIHAHTVEEARSEAKYYLANLPFNTTIQLYQIYWHNQ